MNLIILLAIIVILYFLTGAGLRITKSTEEGFNVSTDPIDCLCRNSENFLSLHKELCAGKITSCNITSYLNTNQKLCRDLGFEPCSNLDYSKNNKNECSALGYNICTFPEYLISNPTECRAAKYEPCKNSTYLLSKPEECLTLNFDACKISAEYLKSNFIKCKSRGVNACTDPGLPTFSKDNPTLCPP